MKVYCPLCKTFWEYKNNRKTLGNVIVQPVKNPKGVSVLTCNKCTNAVDQIADDPETPEDRKLQRLSRLDEELEAEN